MTQSKFQHNKNISANNMSDMIKRYSLFLIGLFIASMGVAFSAKAGLGTSPVASVPYSVSLVSSLLSFGGWLNLLSVIQIVIQVIIIELIIHCTTIIYIGYWQLFRSKFRF